MRNKIEDLLLNYKRGHISLEDTMSSIASYQSQQPTGPVWVKAVQKRIGELNNADADFCKSRWDMTRPEHERLLYRELSNQFTFARQELEKLLSESQSAPIKEQWHHRRQLSNGEVLEMLCEFGNTCRQAERIDISNDAAELITDKTKPSASIKEDKGQSKTFDDFVKESELENVKFHQAMNNLEVQQVDNAIDWISVGTTPAYNKPVLILTNYCKMATAYYVEDYGWTDWMRPEHSYGSVIYWMELPSIEFLQSLKVEEELNKR